MNKTLITVIVVIVVAVGALWLYMAYSTTPSPSDQSAATIATSTVASSTSLMTSTGEAFSQFPYASNAHQIFPTPSADATRAMGAYSYSKEDLGNNTYRITLTNPSRAGSAGQSVVVGGDQAVYFIERSPSDDSDTGDITPTDDYLIAVDANGNILK